MANTLESSFMALSILCPPPSPGISVTESWRSARRTFRAWFVSLSTSRCVRLWYVSPASVSHGLSVRLLVDIWVVSQVHLSGTFLAKSSCGRVLSFLWNKHLGLEWLDHGVGVQYIRFPSWPGHPALQPEWLRVPAAPHRRQHSGSGVGMCGVVTPARATLLAPAFPSPWTSHLLMPSHAYWVGQCPSLQNVAVFGKRVIVGARKSRPPWIGGAPNPVINTNTAERCPCDQGSRRGACGHRPRNSEPLEAAGGSGDPSLECPGEVGPCLVLTLIRLLASKTVRTCLFRVKPSDVYGHLLRPHQEGNSPATRQELLHGLKGWRE
ncbi:uncharacterized protein LOC117800786 isoform X2 [Ailuropoda melanoleuca]|uniref:uncharacterized protein LOC117800786 isoform X2 n=1 Tax=Ailuropoda melanoleuca TaxID=9646 RepID=UPI001494CF26|nr:uncharacterized protein LOC117800786 isoform X2 [Ailuropoda melanoleuca]